MKDEYYIQQAIKQSQESVDAGGYPAGAIIVKDDEIISVGLSNGKKLFDATLHNEIDAIRNASKKLESRSLAGSTLYTSMEPCVMCFSASFWAYIPRIVYACSRSQVDKDYYMGEHSIVDLNEKNYRRKIELVHCKEYSQDALEVIQNWERTKHNNKLNNEEL